MKTCQLVSRSLSSTQPNVVMVTNREQMPSRRTANQREVVRNRNQASVGGGRRVRECGVTREDDQWGI